MMRLIAKILAGTWKSLLSWIRNGSRVTKLDNRLKIKGMQNEYKTISSTRTFEYAHLHLVAFVWQNFDFHIPFDDLILVFIFHFVCLFVVVMLVVCIFKHRSVDRNSWTENGSAEKGKMMKGKRVVNSFHFTAFSEWKFVQNRLRLTTAHSFFSAAFPHISIIFQRIGMIFLFQFL